MIVLYLDIRIIRKVGQQLTYNHANGGNGKDYLFISVTNVPLAVNLWIWIWKWEKSFDIPNILELGITITSFYIL